jgi:hypothetical protein
MVWLVFLGRVGIEPTTSGLKETEFARPGHAFARIRMILLHVRTRQTPTISAFRAAVQLKVQLVRRIYHSGAG